MAVAFLLLFPAGAILLDWLEPMRRVCPKCGRRGVTQGNGEILEAPERYGKWRFCRNCLTYFIHIRGNYEPLCQIHSKMKSSTIQTMGATKCRILQFARTHDALPTSLEQLPSVNEVNKQIIDGWGRPILWQVVGDEGTLTSNGRNGVPGGDGEDADITYIFPLKTNEGCWADEYDEWRVDSAGDQK
jgi:hypothetical protein